jgi:hypothetical protein
MIYTHVGSEVKPVREVDMSTDLPSKGLIIIKPLELNGQCIWWSVNGKPLGSRHFVFAPVNADLSISNRKKEIHNYNTWFSVINPFCHIMESYMYIM